MGGRVPLTYLWHFGGAVPDSTLLNPGHHFLRRRDIHRNVHRDGCGREQGVASIIVNVVSSTSLNTAIVLGQNLGMHCMDREFSIFSILPPFNVVHAQVLMRSGTGTPVLLSDAIVTVRYDAVADATGSINTKSIGKTNFWPYGGALFGMTLQPGQGLLGYYMPGDDPLRRGPQPMAYEATAQAFTALGIPITPLDDALNTNTYPLMRISAAEKTSGNTIGRLDVVVPVASETDCQTCHKTGGIGSTRSGVTWAVDTDIEVQAKKNILRLHDAARGTTLASSTPVLCAGCHYSTGPRSGGDGTRGAADRQTLLLPGHAHLSRRSHDQRRPAIPAERDPGINLLSMPSGQDHAVRARRHEERRAQLHGLSWGDGGGRREVSTPDGRQHRRRE